MKRIFLVFALMASLYVSGCTIEEEKNNKMEK